MTDSTGERLPETPETPEVEPDLVVPGDSEAPTSRGGPVDAKALAKEVAVLLRNDPEFIREAISIKDKRLNLLDPSNPTLVRRLAAALKEQDGDEDKAIRQVRLDLAADRLLGDGGQESVVEAGKPAAQSQKPQKSLKDWASETLTEAGIAFGDPDYKAIVAEFQSGPFDDGEFKGAVRHLIAQRRASAPVKPSAVVGESVGSGGTVTQTGLKDSYIKKALAAKGDRLAMRQLKAEYREKGVPVDEIDLTQSLPAMTLAQKRAAEVEIRKELKSHP